MQFQERKRWLFFGLPFTFTTYHVTEEFITVKSGLLRQKEDDCYMYKIVDTRLVRSLAERIFGLGTVECFGGDATDPGASSEAYPSFQGDQELHPGSFGRTACQKEDAPDAEHWKQRTGTCGSGWRRDPGPSAGTFLRL